MYGSSDTDFARETSYSVNEYSHGYWRYKFRNILHINFLNIFVLSCCFFLLFFSFNTTQVSLK